MQVQVGRSVRVEETEQKIPVMGPSHRWHAPSLRLLRLATQKTGVKTRDGTKFERNDTSGFGALAARCKLSRVRGKRT